MRTLAALVSGLGYDSRVYRNRAGQRVPTDTLLLAFIVDVIQRAVWAMTNRKPDAYPTSLADILLHGPKNSGETVQAFDTPEDFEAAWREGVN